MVAKANEGIIEIIADNWVANRKWAERKGKKKKRKNKNIPRYDVRSYLEQK